MQFFRYVNLILDSCNKNLNLLLLPSFLKNHTFYINKAKYLTTIRVYSRQIPLPSDPAFVEKLTREAALDGWFKKWIENLRSYKNFKTNWKDVKLFEEIKDQRPNYHKLLLSRLSHHTEYTPGLFENASSLCDHIESQQTSTHYKNTLIKAVRIFIIIHQKQDKEEGMRMYRDLCKESEYLFDPTICDMLVSAVCKTADWRESLKLLQVNAFMQKPTSTVLSNVMLAAWKDNDLETFNDLVKQLDGSLPAVSLVEGMVKMGQVEEMLKLANTHSWVLNEKMADVVLNHFTNKNTQGFRVAKVRINNRKCSNCAFQLSPHPGFSDGEMDELRTEFMRNVFVRKGDVFLSSSPQEVDHFKRFINHCNNYDVVVDSLNVVYMLNTTQKADVVMRRVIEKFLKEGKRIVVLSRRHLRKSLKSSIDFNKDSVRWFFADNRSHDDLFALYACFHGNKGCTLVTRDQLRNYSFQMGGRFSKLFSRWQERHQVAFNGVHHNSKQLLFRKAVEHDTRVEWSDGGRSIHIPCRQTPSSVATYDRANFWLCIQQNSNGNIGLKDDDEKINYTNTINSKNNKT